MPGPGLALPGGGVVPCALDSIQSRGPHPHFRRICSSQLPQYPQHSPSHATMREGASRVLWQTLPHEHL